jgi:hypothetical protein
MQRSRDPLALSEGTGSLSENVEKKCHDNADDNACSDGKVKSEVVSLNQDVSRQLPKPRDLWRQDQQDSDTSYDKPYEDENSAEAKQWIHGLQTCAR